LHSKVSLRSWQGYIKTQTTRALARLPGRGRNHDLLSGDGLINYPGEFIIRAGPWGSSPGRNSFLNP
jgi:hypothetical protein